MDLVAGEQDQIAFRGLEFHDTIGSVQGADHVRIVELQDAFRVFAIRCLHIIDGADPVMGRYMIMRLVPFIFAHDITPAPNPEVLRCEVSVWKVHDPVVLDQVIHDPRQQHFTLVFLDHGMIALEEIGLRVIAALLRGGLGCSTVGSFHLPNQAREPIIEFAYGITAVMACNNDHGKVDAELAVGGIFRHRGNLTGSSILTKLGMDFVVITSAGK